MHIRAYTCIYMHIHAYTCIYTQIYTHIHTRARFPEGGLATANLPTKIVDFRGFDSSVILILRGGILMSIGDFPESLTQAMLVGIMLVGRLGVIQ